MSRLSLKARYDFSAEDVKLMADSLRLGHDFRNQLIEAHYYLVEKIAGYYGMVYPFRRDDIKCVACQALVEGVNIAKDILTDNNITAYLAVKIKGAVRDYCASDSLIPIPRGVFKDMQETEVITDFVYRTNDDSEGKIIQHGAGVLQNAAIIIPLGNEYRNIDIPVDDHMTENVEDIYEKVGLTGDEIRVCNGRLDGYTVVEIAQQMECTHPWVLELIRRIKGKLSKLGIKNPESTVLNPATKECSRCKTEKSLSFFYKIGDGLYKSICKNCMKEMRDAKTTSNH